MKFSGNKKLITMFDHYESKSDSFFPIQQDDKKDTSLQYLVLSQYKKKNVYKFDPEKKK